MGQAGAGIGLFRKVAHRTMLQVVEEVAVRGRKRKFRPMRQRDDGSQNQGTPSPLSVAQPLTRHLSQYAEFRRRGLSVCGRKRCQCYAYKTFTPAEKEVGDPRNGTTEKCIDDDTSADGNVSGGHLLGTQPRMIVRAA